MKNKLLVILSAIVMSCQPLISHGSLRNSSSSNDLQSDFIEQLLNFTGLNTFTSSLDGNNISVVSMNKSPGVLEIKNFLNASEVILIPKGRKQGFRIPNSSEVKPGTYTIVVNPKEVDHSPIRRKMFIAPNSNTSYDIRFYKKNVSKFPITLNASPKDSKIRILNIKPKYHPEMVLPKGRYHIEVTAAGYKKKSGWISLDHNQQDFSINLVKK